MSPVLTLDHLRRFAIARSLFPPTTLGCAIDRLGFVQADPIRAPARAQDLTLRHRILDYRAGDLERRYAELPVEEEHFVNYGFLPQGHAALLHPRSPRREWDKATRRRAALVLDFVRARGEVHPRAADEHFAHGTVTNYWGGSSNATTQVLDALHYCGLLRVARREAGIRVYAPRPVTPEKGRLATPQARADALLALAIDKYAPLPAPSLGPLASRLRYAAPQLGTELKEALNRAKKDLPRSLAEGIDWYWPTGEDPLRVTEEGFDRVRLLAPFDPVVWDRRRFEILWGWPYRFEAYTPAPKRKLGYYALPLLFRDQVIGWGNLTMRSGVLAADIGYLAGRAPRDGTFKRELEAELERMRIFLGRAG